MRRSACIWTASDLKQSATLLAHRCSQCSEAGCSFHLALRASSYALWAAVPPCDAFGCVCPCLPWLRPPHHLQTTRQ